MLDRVTITGADDSIPVTALPELSARYPFVEWGILVSASRLGTLRYPCAEWIRRLQYEAMKHAGMKLSLHLCGRYVRALLIGEVMFPVGLLDGFDRVQLNFHAEHCAVDTPEFIKALKTLGPRQFIFQLDEAFGNRYLEKVLDDPGVDAVPLFDASGGAGVLPTAGWPRSIYGNGGITSPKMLYHGYAGGLGPDNLGEQIPAIGAAAGCRHWIDMETRVRTENNHFDLDLVERALRISAGFIDRPDLYSRRA